MSNLDEYLIEKLKEWPALKNVPEPIIHEVVLASCAFMAELPIDPVEPDAKSIDALIHFDGYHICVKCDKLSEMVVQEEPQSATHIPRPTMCVLCWNALAIKEGRMDDLYCEKCGRVQPCENEECVAASGSAS